MQMRRYRPTSGASRSEITAVVKWFNPAKGFGFVQPSDGSPDAFLHISVVEQVGRQSIAEGATLVCDLSEGGRGPQVAAIHEITDPEEGAIAAPQEVGGEPIHGVVKFFNLDKGFGFITPDDGGRDVFFSARFLERAGLPPPAAAQRVSMVVRQGQKGPMVDRLELL